SARSPLFPDVARVAIRVWNWRDAGAHRDFLSSLDSGESALVDDPWAQSRGGTNRGRRGTKDYGKKCDRDHRSRLQRNTTHADSNAHAYAMSGNLGRDRARTSP